MQPRLSYCTFNVTLGLLGCCLHKPSYVTGQSDMAGNGFLWPWERGKVINRPLKKWHKMKIQKNLQKVKTPKRRPTQAKEREIAKWGLKTWVSLFVGGKEGTIPSSLALSTFNCFFLTDVKGGKKPRQQTPPPNIAATAANGGGVIVNEGIHLEMRLVNCCRQCIAQGCSDRRCLETLG